jgi:2-polyprenyl-3-methyl-5-hydroxy-6-metoxy-1,4-benzoquinol methylase
MDRSMLISDGYRDQNKILHETCPEYGSKHRSHRFARAREIAASVGALSILDYGCGKGASGVALGAMLYDPAIESFSQLPGPADLVICWDVLEHVEPNCLDSVLTHIKSLAIKSVYLVIATRADSSKLLPDGRNPHLIVKPAQWWIDTALNYWGSISATVIAKPGEVEIVWKC